MSVSDDLTVDLQISTRYPVTIILMIWKGYTINHHTQSNELIQMTIFSYAMWILTFSPMLSFTDLKMPISECDRSIRLNIKCILIMAILAQQLATVQWWYVCGLSQGKWVCTLYSLKPQIRWLILHIGGDSMLFTLRCSGSPLNDLKYYSTYGVKPTKPTKCFKIACWLISLPTSPWLVVTFLPPLCYICYGHVVYIYFPQSGSETLRALSQLRPYLEKSWPGIIQDNAMMRKKIPRLGIITVLGHLGKLGILNSQLCSIMDHTNKHPR